MERMRRLATQAHKKLLRCIRPMPRVANIDFDLRRDRPVIKVNVYVSFQPNRIPKLLISARFHAVLQTFIPKFFDPKF